MLKSYMHFSLSNFTKIAKSNHTFNINCPLFNGGIWGSWVVVNHLQVPTGPINTKKQGKAWFFCSKVEEISQIWSKFDFFSSTVKKNWSLQIFLLNWAFAGLRKQNSSLQIFLLNQCVHCLLNWRPTVEVDFEDIVPFWWILIVFDRVNY